MGSFGERMQREREMRGISLEEIAESTKIGTRMLRALEQEEFSKLPGGIFNKGFVRAYARYLGIDEEQAVTDFVAAERESQAKSNVIPFSNGIEAATAEVEPGPTDTHIMRSMAAAKERTEPQPDQGRGFLTAAVVVVLALGVGALAWRYIPNSRQAAPQPEVHRPAAVQNQAVPAQTLPQSVNPATQPPANSATQATRSNPSQPATTPNATSAALPASVAPQPAIVVDIRATGESWFKGKMDETSTEFTLSAGGTRQLTADKQLTLTIGNASAVEITFNGKPLPGYAAGTKKKTLTFAPQGLQQ
jgi:cytoskeleton protein RodZ